MARRKKAGGAVAVLPNPTPPNPEPENLAKQQDMLVPAGLLLAAVSVSPTKDPTRFYLQSVFVHSVDGTPRVAATDGNRLFVASFEAAKPRPDWLEQGLMISNDGLKAQLGMIAKSGEAAMVRVRFGKGQPKVELSDERESMVFKTDLVDGEFPQYQRVIPAESFSHLDANGDPIGSEWEPVGINSKYLKHIGEVARTLESSLPKSERSDGGMVVRAFNGNSDASKPSPLVFDFSNYPGAILVIMAARLATPAISTETAILLAPAIKLTIAALKAHGTRWLQRAEDTQDPTEKEMALARAENFRLRVEEVLRRAPGLPAIGATAEPAPEEAAAAE